MMVTICVPPELAGLLELPVRTMFWDGTGEPPAGCASVTFWVPPYLFSTQHTRRAGVAAMPALRVIQLLSAGVEHWSGDVPYGVVLCSGRGIHGRSTAELAIAGLLALLRDIPTYALQQRHAQWLPVEGESLDGKRVLIVGAGDIGQQVACVAEALGAQVTLVARRPHPGALGAHSVAELPRLLPEHDVVVLAVPATPATVGLVDAAFLAAMPGGAVLVNVSRGRVVDTDALLAELTAGRLRAVL
ncbi:MAG: NAD-binding protein, partial [Actinomycetia bacterium]|nr:NAD-binding protein [Actinomycetes bacterium]